MGYVPCIYDIQKYKDYCISNSEEQDYYMLCFGKSGSNTSLTFQKAENNIGGKPDGLMHGSP
jgi:hypothetical protein